MSEFWRVVESNLPLVAVLLSLGTLIGIAVNAWMSTLNYRSMNRYNLPMVTVAQRLPHTDLPHMFDFTLEPGSKWLITGMRLKGRWRRHLAKVNGYVKDNHGEFVRYKTGPWKRRLRFDPPVDDGFVMIHRDAPDSFLICFEVCLRSSTSARNCVTRRLFIHV